MTSFSKKPYFWLKSMTSHHECADVKSNMKNHAIDILVTKPMIPFINRSKVRPHTYIITDFR